MCVCVCVCVFRASFRYILSHQRILELMPDESIDDILSCDWNTFIDATLLRYVVVARSFCLVFTLSILCVFACFSGGKMKLASVLGSVCAGINVLYRDSGDSSREGRRKSRSEGLVSLESIHSTLLAHKEFHDILFSKLDSQHSISAKGTYTFTLCHSLQFTLCLHIIL